MAKKHEALPTSEGGARLAADLRLKLQQMGIQLSEHKSVERLPVDAADVYSICANYQRLIESFLALPDRAQSQDVLRIVFEIEQHLYDHLAYHYKPLRNGLTRLARLVEPDEKRIEDFALRYLEQVSEKTRSDL